MKASFFCLALACGILLSLTLPAQDRSDTLALAAGAFSPEELDESEMERLSSMLERKVRINTASRSRLVSSGLFTPYQAASIIDWRSRNGDILSFTELSSLDGFGRDAVERLRPFISLESFAPPGASSLEKGRVKQEILLKGGVKGDSRSSWGLRYKFFSGDRFEAGFASRSNFSDASFPPGSSSFSALVRPRSKVSTIIAGDYHARFGQGLAMWSGFSLSGFAGASSFCRRPSGIAPAVTFSSAVPYRGVAAEAVFGRFGYSAGVFFPGLKKWMDAGGRLDFSAGAFQNLTFYSRLGQCGATWISGGAVSADFHYCISGIDCFGEVAYCNQGKAIAALGGVSVPLGGEWRFSALARGYPAGYSNPYSGAARAGTKVTDEYGAAFGLSRGAMDFTIDARCSAKGEKGQVKALLKFPLLQGEAWKVTARIGERLRGYGIRNRTDARLDVNFARGPMTAAIRGNVLFCKGFGALSYAEAGYKGDRLSCYLRGTVFRIDSWDDRIYVYERDAPGNFTVPAYYGRGYGLSAYCALKFVSPGRYNRYRLCLRAWTTGYAKDMEKPGDSGLKLQVNINL